MYLALIPDEQTTKALRAFAPALPSDPHCTIIHSKAPLPAGLPLPEWPKLNGSYFINAKKQPMKSHEDVVVFYRQQPTYNPQMEIRGKPRKKGGGKASPNTGVVPSVSFNNEYYPRSIITASTGSQSQP